MDHKSPTSRPVSLVEGGSQPVVPIEASDLPTLARFMHASSLQQATNRFLFLDWPNETAQIALFEKGAEQSFKDPSHRIVKTIDVRGDMTGYIMLTRKVPDPQDKPGETKKEPSKGPEGINLEFRAVMGRAMAEIQKGTPPLEHFGQYTSPLFLEEHVMDD